MKIIPIFLLLVAALPSYSQNEKVLEPAILECRYIYSAVNDTITWSKRKDDNTVLRIGKSVSQFFSAGKYSTDSLGSTPEGIKIWGQRMLDAIGKGEYKNMPGSNFFKDYIYKNYPNGGLTSYTTDGKITPYECKEDYEPQSWVVKDSTKQVMGYSCQLASCTFRGRQYFAWFTLDIPISDGPWKFNGLPGLILEVYDKADHYHFTAVGLQQSNLLPVTLYNCNKKYIKAGRIELLKEKYAVLFSRRNVMAEFEAETGISIGGSTTPSAKKQKAYDFIERDYR